MRRHGRLYGIMAVVIAAVAAFGAALGEAMAWLARGREDPRWWRRALRRERWRDLTRGFSATLRGVYWRLLCRAYGIPAVIGGAETSAIKAFGATMTWNAVAVAEIAEFRLPEITAETTEVTHNESPAGFKEFLASLRDGGTLGIKGNFIPSDTNGQIAMHTDAAAGTKRNVVFTFASAAATTWTFSGIITRLAILQPDGQGGAIGFEAEIKVTSQPTLAVTASANLTTLTGIEENVGAALTFAPVFAGGTYAYMVTVNAASTWIKVTPTLAGATITITQDSDSNSQTVASGAQSGTIALTDAKVTKVTLSVKETGKVAKIYTLYVYNA